MALLMQPLEMSAIVRQYGTTQAVRCLEDREIIRALPAVFLSRDDVVTQTAQLDNDRQFEVFIGI